MPICENCKSYKYAVLRIKLPKILRKKNKVRDFSKRKTAWFCFECIRDKARDCLKPSGYWFQFVFPHMMPVHRRYKGI